MIRTTSTLILALGLGLTSLAAQSDSAAPQEASRAAAEEIEGRIADLQSKLRELEKERRALSRELKTLRRKLRPAPRNPRSLFDDLQTELRLGFPGTAPDRLFDFGFSGGNESFSMSTEADGSVRVEVQSKNDAGEPERKIYEAESLDALRKKHPEIAKKLPLGGFNFRFETLDDVQSLQSFNGDFGNLREDLEDMLKGLREGGALGTNPFSGFDRNRGPRTGSDKSRSPFGIQPRRPAMPSPSKERLGVEVSTVEADTALELGVDRADERLRVRSVAASSLAARLGMKKGDVILSINGNPVLDPKTIAKELRNSGPTDQIEVEVFRPEKGNRTLRALKTASKKSRRI